MPHPRVSRAPAARLSRPDPFGSRRHLVCLFALGLLAGCSDPLDIDLRGAFGEGALSTAAAARDATAARPEPDGRGVLAYPGYQVAVARRGDTVQSVGARIGMDADELARFNGLQTGDVLRDGEVLALPRRVAEPAPTGTAASGTVDIASLAGSAIDRATPGAQAGAQGGEGGGAQGGAQAGVQATPLPPAPAPGPEPLRHKVTRGETAYTTARLYAVPVRSLAEWNGLDPNYTIREGQYLIIPVTNQTAPRPVAAAVVPPGAGSPTPVPPSASKPLPAEKTVPAAAAVATAAAPDLGRTQSAASAARMTMPVQGKVIRDYKKGSNDGLDIQAAAGTAVVAADSGTVAAITADADQVPIIVIRHPDNLLTVYANVDGITVKKDDTVKRGQTIAKLRGGTANYLHFEVRKGFDSVDPTPYLN